MTSYEQYNSTETGEGGKGMPRPESTVSVTSTTSRKSSVRRSLHGNTPPGSPLLSAASLLEKQKQQDEAARNKAVEGGGGGELGDPSTPLQQHLHHHHEYKTVAMRWLVLVEYGMLSFLNGWIWICFSNIVDETVEFFNTTTYFLDTANYMFYVMFLVCCFPALAFFDKFGIKKTLLVASSCNLFSAAAKLLAALIPGLRGFPILLISQLFGGASQCFFLPVAASLSATWFGDDERTLATMAAAASNPLGGAFGILAAPLFVSEQNKGTAAFTSLFLTIAGLCAFDFLLLLFVIPEKPRHSPSEAAHLRRALFEEQKSLAIKDRLSKIFNELLPVIKDGKTMLLIVGGGFAAGAFWTYTSLISQIAIPFSVGQKDVGIAGFLCLVIGTPCGLYVAHKIDQSRIYKMNLLLVLASIVVIQGLLCVFLYALPQIAVGLIMSVTILLGIPQNLILPIAFESSAETIFPIGENLCGTLVLFFSEVGAMIFTSVLPALLDGSARGAILVIVVLTISTFVALVMILFSKVELKRLRASEAGDENESVTDADDDGERSFFEG